MILLVPIKSERLSSSCVVIDFDNIAKEVTFEDKFIGFTDKRFTLKIPVAQLKKAIENAGYTIGMLKKDVEAVKRFGKFYYKIVLDKEDNVTKQRKDLMDRKKKNLLAKIKDKEEEIKIKNEELLSMKELLKKLERKSA